MINDLFKGAGGTERDIMVLLSIIHKSFLFLIRADRFIIYFSFYFILLIYIVLWNFLEISFLFLIALFIGCGRTTLKPFYDFGLLGHRERYDITVP